MVEALLERELVLGNGEGEEPGVAWGHVLGEGCGGLSGAGNVAGDAEAVVAMGCLDPDKAGFRVAFVQVGVGSALLEVGQSVGGDAGVLEGTVNAGSVVFPTTVTPGNGGGGEWFIRG